MDYIESILSKEICIRCTSILVRKQLLGLHAARERGGDVYVPFESKEHLAFILRKLQTLGLLFADAPAGWPPAAVFEHLRDEGLLQGRIKTVTWRQPNQPVLGLD
ncbi:hypothetical protein [Parachitinimonas caeni]|uniref:Uncharacterized protein n=1 Tax=Parachitinimonas caeni TaxID=3031301 RepID=A0ABT7DSH1_9NEIS|nr:hypothetical protein [Parachitinimonas caeni]MDK2123013.1 hypothetical protein [Parachitinimonas caeni]